MQIKYQERKKEDCLENGTNLMLPSIVHVLVRVPVLLLKAYHSVDAGNFQSRVY